MHLLFRPRVIEPLIAKHSFQLGRINVKVGRTYKAGQQRVSGGGGGTWGHNEVRGGGEGPIR